MANWLTFEQVAQYAARAGWKGEALTVAVAIAAAESGKQVDGDFKMNAEAIGDVELTTKLEQSTGLWQINYRPLRDKGNPVRDPIANLDPATNARNAYAISAGGTNWQPWSTYTSGAYRQHLARAREATLQEAAGEPSEDPGRQVAYHRPLLPALDIKLGGLALAGEIGNSVVGGSVDLTADEVSELTLEFESPDLQLLAENRLTIGTAVDHADLRFEIIRIETFQGPATPHVRIVAHPTGVVAMRETTPSSTNDISPTEYLSRIATAVGLAFRGETTAVETNIGPVNVDDPRAPGGTRMEYAWEVGQRLAEDAGFLFFEAGGTLYFASPRFLNGAGRSRHVVWLGRQTFAGETSEPTVNLIELPTCTGERTHQSQGKRLLRYVTIEGLVPREDGEKFRPGDNLLLSGVPLFEGGGRMITRVSWSLNDLHSPVEFTAESVLSLAENLNQSTGTGLAVNTAVMEDAPASGRSKSALDFVTFCLRQVGDTYIFGAETRLDDPDPDAFDCSELIQWAAAQVGVDFVDGSANQIAASRNAGLTVSLEEAFRTRGALLYRPGHIAVSLGDGRRTVEARGRKYGVVEGPVAGRGWTEAGLIPGMRYR